VKVHRQEGDRQARQIITESESKTETRHSKRVRNLANGEHDDERQGIEVSG
jgi:hypothetical protein